MSKRGKTVFVCQECGYESSQWIGKCICGAWNSLIEEKIPEAKEDDVRRRSTCGEQRGKPSKLAEVGTMDYQRLETGISELNRVLGGGLVQGSLVLISGEPGIGKSTMILQTAVNIASQGKKVLYISGEESENQIKMRADRVCNQIPTELYVLSETNMENMEVAFDNIQPAFLIVDSIQTMYSDSLDSAPGSVSQVRACGNLLMKIGKTRNVPIFIVAHVTKAGELAGPKTVEHLVDCVLNFTGERDQELRILRSYKNRFGTTSEIGAFTMEGDGLKEVRDISATFLENREDLTEGAVTTAVYEGSRPVMFEIQALVTPASGVGFSRRTAVGIDNQRLSMMVAVMEKKAKSMLGNQDIYVNVVGGIRPEGTGTDLAVALAIHSSFKRVTPTKRTLAMGEIGLTGDLRSVQNGEKIVKEAIRMGYEKIIMPERNAQNLKRSYDECEIIGVRTLMDAIRTYEK